MIFFKTKGLFLLLLLPFFQQTVAQELIPNQKMTKTIRLEQAHRYTVQLNKGQFAIINLQQKGIDLQITSFDSEGKKIEEFDSPNGSNGPELAVIDANKKGTYAIEVKALGEKKKIKQGIYDLEILPLNNAPEKQLEEILKLLNSREALPGFGVSIVTKDEIKYKKGFGFANVENKTPYTTETIHNIGSTSKTLIGLALMKLVEENKLNLETPINDILPFKVINPYFPNTPITVKHLANHSSTIKETKDYERSYVLLEKKPILKTDFHKSEYKDFSFYQKNKAMPMTQFLRNIVSKDGAWYRKKNFLKEKPGTKFSYTNAGATLAAYIVELISGETFDQFTKKNIIDPLGLKNTGWSFDQVDMSAHAMLYSYHKKPLPKYKLITYPDGGLITNVSGLSKYLMELMKGYVGESKLLSAASFQEMMVKQQFNTQRKNRSYGLFWEVKGQHRMGHNGGDPGIVSMMYFDPEKRVGTVMMCNMIPALSAAQLEFMIIQDVLRRYSKYFKN